MDHCARVAQNACTRAPILCLWVSCCTLMPYSMFLYFCCRQIQSDICPMHGKDFHPSHRGLWKTRALGGRDVGVPPFKTPTLNKGMLQAVGSMRDGYHSKMLLYALDKLFYVYAQIKNSPQNEKIMLAYEILCISGNRCTDRHKGIEKMGVPNALALLNIEDA